MWVNEQRLKTWHMIKKNKTNKLTFDTILVDVDYHQGQPMFLLYHFQEVFSTLKLIDCFKRRTEAQALVHVLHTLFSVAFQATFILFLDQFVLLDTHLEMRKCMLLLHLFATFEFIPFLYVCPNQCANEVQSNPQYIVVACSICTWWFWFSSSVSTYCFDFVNTYLCNCVQIIPSLPIKSVTGMFFCMWGFMSISTHLSVDSLLVILSWTGHLSEQLSFAVRDSLIHTVQLKPSPVINYTFWTCRQKMSTQKKLVH